MGCSDFLELISAYIDDELTKKETKKLLEHLERCESCARSLNELTFQKETVASLSTCYDGPHPHDYFAKDVMALIQRQSETMPHLNPLQAFFSNLAAEMVAGWRKPAFALSCAVLIALGAVVGVAIKKQTEPAKLLSVYELPASSMTETVPTNEAGEETDSRLFDHFARSSAETFATTPCLLEYAAYTCTSSND